MPGLPGGRLARLSRYSRVLLVLARAAWCDDRALGDGCSWGHGWSFRITRRVQLVGLIVEHLTSSRCAAVDVGFFVSQSVSLQRRMWPQAPVREQLWLRRLDGAAGLRMARRVAGVAMAPRSAPGERGLVWDPFARFCARM